MVRIQPFEPRYREGVAQVIVPIQTEEFGVAVTYEQQPDLHDIPGFYQKGAGDFWVALNQADEVVGTAALLDIGEGQAALRKMFVAVDYRGQPHGVARRLLETLLAHAYERGLRALYLGTTDKFLAAHRFYEKNGFRRVEADTLPASFPRMDVDSIFYRHDLEPA